MMTNFNSKMFVLKNLSQWLVVFLAYVLLSGNSLLLINSMDVVPQVNVREVIWFFMGQSFNFAFFGMSFAFLCVSLFNAFVEKYSAFYGLTIGNELFKKDSVREIFFCQILDFSNPFLRSSKTKGLRE